MRRISGKFVFFALIAAAAIMLVYNAVADDEGPDGDYVAAICIEGVIEGKNRYYDQKWLLDLIDTLEEDGYNRGILLLIDSPGGTVYESDEAYLRLMEYKDNTSRPVYAYFKSLAASGAYYIACAADRIYANRNTLTGSIGIIAGQTLDATELMEKIGVKSTTFTAGRNKNLGNYNQPLTQEQREIMQSLADDCYEQFVGIVSKSRSLPLEATRELADGRIYCASQALDLKLIDGICNTPDAAFRIMTDENFRGESVDSVEFKPENKESIMEMIMGACAALQDISALARGGRISAAAPFRPMYLYAR